MTDLPEDRVESTPPFTYRGLDCFVRAVQSQGKKKETEEIRNDIHLHEFTSSALRAVR